MNPISTRLRTSRKPALLHLGLSIAIALIAMGLIFRVWYPGELAAAQGVSHLVIIMIGVDVVIGPMITAIVFDSQKPGIKFDIVTIATMQAGALLYGLHTAHAGRPIYMVFNVDRFDVVAFQDLNKESLAKVRSDLRPHAWRPRTVAARLPKSRTERSSILFSAIHGGPDLPQLPQYYVPLQDEREAMLVKLRPLEDLQKINSVTEGDWQHLVGGLGRQQAELGYLPLSANAKDGAVIMDRHSGDIVGIRMLTPKFGSTKRRPLQLKQPAADDRPQD